MKKFLKCVGVIAGVCIGIKEIYDTEKERQFIQGWILDNKDKWDKINSDPSLKSKVYRWNYNYRSTRDAMIAIRAADSLS